MPTKNPRRVAAGKRAAQTRATNRAAAAAAALANESGGDPPQDDPPQDGPPDGSNHPIDSARNAPGARNSILARQTNHMNAIRRYQLRGRNVNDPTIPTTMNSLRRIPPEVRQMILSFSGVGKDTLAAFAGDQVIYYDALKVYWETTRFTLPHNLDHPWKFSDSSLSKTSLSSIKKIKIEARMENKTFDSLLEVQSMRNTQTLGWKGWKCMLPPMSELVLLNVTDLRIQFFSQRSTLRGGPMYRNREFTRKRRLLPHLIISRVRDCLAAFSGTDPGLRTLSCEFEYFQMMVWEGDWTPIDLLNEAFGVKAKLRTVNTGYIYQQVFFWENPGGEILRWWNGNTQGASHHQGRIRQSLTLEDSPYFRGDKGEMGV